MNFINNELISHYLDDQCSTSSSSMGGDSGRYDSTRNFQFPDIKSHKVKTEMCKFWLQQSTCPYQFNCNFAHGHEELHMRLDLPSNYRTRECQNYTGMGHCQYGNRCQFKHIIKQEKCDLPQLYYSLVINQVEEFLLQNEMRIKRSSIFKKFVRLQPSSTLQ